MNFAAIRTYNDAEKWEVIKDKRSFTEFIHTATYTEAIHQQTQSWQ